MLNNARPTQAIQATATPFKSIEQEKTLRRNPVRLVLTEDKEKKQLHLEVIR